jgi:hypothetical protein
MHEILFAKPFQTETNFDLKTKKLSDVGHILQQSRNQSQRICSTRPDGEQGILSGSTVLSGLKDSSS